MFEGELPPIQEAPQQGLDYLGQMAQSLVVSERNGEFVGALNDGNIDLLVSMAPRSDITEARSFAGGYLKKSNQYRYVHAVGLLLDIRDQGLVGLGLLETHSDFLTGEVERLLEASRINGEQGQSEIAKRNHTQAESLHQLYLYLARKGR
jgi:hypothetical protein